MLQKAFRDKIVKTQTSPTKITFGIAIFLPLLWGCGSANSPSPNSKRFVSPEVEAKGRTQEKMEQDQNQKAMEAMQMQMDIQMMPKDKKK